MSKWTVPQIDAMRAGFRQLVGERPRPGEDGTPALALLPDRARGCYQDVPVPATRDGLTQIDIYTTLKSKMMARR
jgi:hypothetical protein